MTIYKSNLNKHIKVNNLHPVINCSSLHFHNQNTLLLIISLSLPFHLPTSLSGFAMSFILIIHITLVYSVIRFIYPLSFYHFIIIIISSLSFLTLLLCTRSNTSTSFMTAFHTSLLFLLFFLYIKRRRLCLL